MSWGLSDVPNLSEKTVAITGATSGIGLHAAKILAHHGAKVVMLCRNVDKMASVASSIHTEKASDIVQLQCDTSDLESVRACAEAFKNSGIPRLDALILNAGAIAHEFKQTPQGLESMFATNHLGHWLLTGLLMDFIKDVPDSRIVLVSSIAHRSVKKIDYDVARGVNGEKFRSFEVYGGSKLANLWMAASLNRRLEKAGAKTIAVPAHPGITESNLAGPSPPLIVRAIQFLSSPLTQSTEQGSLPLVMAATDPSITKDSYCGPGRFFEVFGPPIASGNKTPAAGDVEKAEELWTISEELCNFEYSF